MADTLSEGILKSVKDTLTAYLPAKVRAFRPGQVKWHYTDKYVDPAEAPAVLIVDRGWSTIEQTCRSTDLTGANVGGIVRRRMSCEIRVWNVAQSQD
jgi:hypothetical protein